jgi:hypothetical protein
VTANSPVFPFLNPDIIVKYNERIAGVKYDQFQSGQSKKGLGCLFNQGTTYYQESQEQCEQLTTNDLITGC